MNRGLLYAMFPIILTVAFVGSLESIPGPPYGGDLYFHNGIAEAIFHGTPFFRDPTNYEGYAFYPWFYHFIVALLGHIAGGVMPVTVYVMPVFILLLSIITVYFLVGELTTESVAVLAPLLPISLHFPDPHPHTLLLMVFIPLFYFVLVRYLKAPSTRNGIFLGVSWALGGLTHVLGTFGIGAVILSNVAWDVGRDRDLSAVRRWIIPFLVAIPPLLLYWGPLLFVYHARTPNPYQSLVWAHYTIVSFTADMVTFFVSYSWRGALSLLALAGLYALVKTRPYPAVRIFVSSLLGMYVEGIVFILLGNPLIAKKLSLYFFTLDIILISVGITYLLSRFSQKKSLVVVTAILLVLSGATVVESASNPWVQIGFHEFPFESLQAWLLENTNVNDVILSNYEASFMLFSISGRKTVLFRRTHASPFVDYDKRSADIMVALLGNNGTRTLQILEKYHVKYIYVDKSTSSDPLWVPVSYKGYLEVNGVPCHVEWVRYDPADPSSVKIKACVAQFNISRLVPYLQEVFRRGDSVLFRVCYPDERC
ncbi:glycosyltransferase family 39 protein [Thermococcus sp.]|uniref:glycosyltransferase family 39 protein n=1 Tax=Thermococcus sp. TaxID=35749 RepID=UPI0026259BFD|nr:glycosyltransferase family 39 protein [Thermococcus sp.]